MCRPLGCWSKSMEMENDHKSTQKILGLLSFLSTSIISAISFLRQWKPQLLGNLAPRVHWTGDPVILLLSLSGCFLRSRLDLRSELGKRPGSRNWVHTVFPLSGHAGPLSICGVRAWALVATASVDIALGSSGFFLCSYCHFKSR